MEYGKAPVDLYSSASEEREEEGIVLGPAAIAPGWDSSGVSRECVGQGCWCLWRPRKAAGSVCKADLSATVLLDVAQLGDYIGAGFEQDHEADSIRTR
jgi:hypothetical protein